ncbi:MAG: hypothetical protein WCI30_08195 [Clostridia bacterium]
MDITQALDKLEMMIEEARKIPFTGKVMLDPVDLLESLDFIRSVLPSELSAAVKVIREKEQILTDAKIKADRSITDAKDYVKQLVDESEIKRNIDRKAEEVLNNARQSANEVRYGAYKYANEVLSHVENVVLAISPMIKREVIDQMDYHMEEIIDSIRANHESLQSASTSTSEEYI